MKINRKIKKFENWDIILNNDVIPTAEELMNSEKYEPDNGIPYGDYWGESSLSVPSMMVEFAKLHVKAALKAAHKKHQIPEEDIEFTLSSYPEYKIKL